VDEIAAGESKMRTAENSDFLQRFSAPKLAVRFAFHCYTFEDFAENLKDFRTVLLPSLQSKETLFL